MINEKYLNDLGYTTRDSVGSWLDWWVVFPQWVTPAGRVVSKRGSPTYLIACYQSMQVFNGIYTYLPAQNYTTRVKMRIICVEHGEFNAVKYNHLKGSGCSKCSCVHKKKVKEAPGAPGPKVAQLERLKEVHGDTYSYPGFAYSGSKGKILIVCKEHGEFLQVFHTHRRGSGCPKCSRGGNRLTTELAVLSIKKVHGDRYNYSKVHYQGGSSNIDIICKVHGVFSQKYVDHQQGSGCPKCCGQGLSNEERLYELTKIHGSRYDYSDTIYTRPHENLNIVCRVHGIFSQRYSHHKAGRGCPKCSNKSYDKVYLLKDSDGHIKVGVTGTSMKLRLQDIKARRAQEHGIQGSIEVVHVLEGLGHYQALGIERHLLDVVLGAYENPYEEFGLTEWRTNCKTNHIIEEMNKCV